MERIEFRAIAWLDGEPVGFIQSYVAAKSGDGWWPDETDSGVLGIESISRRRIAVEPRYRHVETPDGRALLMYCERPI